MHIQYNHPMKQPAPQSTNGYPHHNRFEVKFTPCRVRNQPGKAKLLEICCCCSEDNLNNYFVFIGHVVLIPSFNPPSK